MASPPPSTTPLALPRQRPSLALPGQSHSHSQPSLSSARKPSLNLSTATTTPSLHPLRQTSFPPPSGAADSLEAQHAAAAEDAAALRLAQYSPSQPSDLDLEDEFSDSEIVSAISGPATNLDDAGAGGGTRKRKRGEKKPRGRPAKARSLFSTRTGSVSLVNGEAGGTSEARGGGRGSERAGTVGADEDDENDDDDDDDDAGAAGAAAATSGGQGGRLPLYEGGALAPHEFNADTESKSRFRHYMETLDSLPLTSTSPSRSGLTVRDMSERYDVYQRAKLRNQDLRRLVNQTLSQSVPSNVVTVVSSYAKMFAGMIVEEARRVQGEWMAVEAKRADGEVNEVYERLNVAEHERLREDEDESEAREKDGEDAAATQKTSPARKEGTPSINHEPASSNPPTPTTQTQTETPGQTHLQSQPPVKTPNQAPTDPVHPGGAGGLFPSFSECDRGPLQPDHLREALRRYKKARAGGTVGFTGLSLEGREVAAVRVGGRRLFR